MPSPSGIRKDSSIFAFGDGGGMPPPYNGVRHINNHLPYKGGRFVNRPYGEYLNPMGIATALWAPQ